MIYLEKTASAQTVSIPRNDNGGTPSVNPRSYQSGYTDGVAYQKSLLSSTAITQNGDYQSENGFSAVSVNVPQTGSSLPLTAITIRTNTAITIEDKAVTGITVDVPQLNVEPNKSFTATSNGNYTIIPNSTGVTTILNSEYTSNYFEFTAQTSNYPIIGRYDIIKIEEDDGISYKNFGYLIIFINNNTYSYDDSNWRGGSIVAFFSSNNLLYFKIFGDNARLKATVLTNGYDAMSAVSLTVNVPQTGITIPLTSITITANTAITETDKAYTGITVDVDTASTYNSGYTDGYASGETDGYNTGYASGYTSGITEGENNIISTFTAITATTNGVYGSSAHPLSAVTVDVPQTAITSDVKYVDYIEINTSGLVGTGSTHWIFTDNIGNQSHITVNFDFMPLASNASGKHEFIGGPICLSCNKPISNKKYDLKINGKYYLPWDGIVFNTNTRYNCYFSTETNVNNTAYVIINGNYFEVEYTDSASAAIVRLNGSNPINQGETFSTTTGRYYGIKVTSGSTILVDARPALDNNNNPCFYDIISNSYIYHTGNSIPVAGNLLSLEEVFNRYYDYGYNTGYASGYTSGKTNGYASGYSVGYDSGYTSGETNGYASGYTDGYSSGYTSGETVGYIDCSKNSIIGYRIGEVLLSWIQSISSDTLTIFMDIILPYDDYAVFPFSYSALTEKYIELGYFQNYLRVEGNIANDEVDYYFTNPTPAEGRRVICQININPLINNRINVWLYDFVDGQGTYGVLSANSIINLNQLIRIQSCIFNELKLIKNGELIDDFRYNGNGKIVDAITGIEYGENIVPYNPYSSN